MATINYFQKKRAYYRWLKISHIKAVNLKMSQDERQTPLRLFSDITNIRFRFMVRATKEKFDDNGGEKSRSYLFFFLARTRDVETYWFVLQEMPWLLTHHLRLLFSSSRARSEKQFAFELLTAQRFLLINFVFKAFSRMRVSVFTSDCILRLELGLDSS